jgi:hypothetical protein
MAATRTIAPSSRMLLLAGALALGVGAALLSLRLRGPTSVPWSGHSQSDGAQAATARAPSAGTRGQAVAAAAGAPSRAGRPEAPEASADDVPGPVASQVIQLFKGRPRNVYNAELRHATWAPAMETQLQARFRAQDLAAFPGLRLAELECRTSSCRVVIEYPQQLMDRLFPEPGQRRGRVINQYIKANGPFATRTNVIDGTTPGRETALLFFGEREIDPRSYPAWVDSARAAIQAERARAVQGAGTPAATSK